MTAIHETTMALRFFGDDLDPDEITALVGYPPTVSTRKGEVSITKRGTEKIARTGSWLLRVEARQPGDIDGQVAELFTSLNDDLTVWASLTARFQADIFCGFWMKESNEGLGLSVATMKELACRNLSLEFDIYDPPTPD